VPLPTLLGLGIRAANNICNKWLESGFVEASSKAKKIVAIYWARSGGD
jgi:hypothetical protein